jgi:sRNA-binding carbon storage regulator CsrA
MLVLSRKRDERVIAAVSIADLKRLITEAEVRGDDRLHLVTVQVVKLAGPMVRLGFNAEKVIDIIREEILVQENSDVCPSE